MTSIVGRQIQILPILPKRPTKIAHFEDLMVFKGLPECGVVGLSGALTNKPLIREGSCDFVAIVTKAVANLRERAVNGPYALVLGRDHYIELLAEHGAFPASKWIRDIIDGPIIFSHVLKEREAYLLSMRGQDFEIVLGQDIALGYYGHNTREIHLYFTESVTFQVINEAAFIMIRG